MWDYTQGNEHMLNNKEFKHLRVFNVSVDSLVYLSTATFSATLVDIQNCKALSACDIYYRSLQNINITDIENFVFLEGNFISYIFYFCHCS